MKLRRKSTEFRREAHTCFEVAGILTFLLLGICSGCAVRHVPYGSYQLVERDGASFLLPPSSAEISTKTVSEKTSLGKPVGDESSQIPDGCSIHGRWFSFYPDKSGNWIAEVPLPAAWENSDLFSTMRSDWGNFLDRLYELEERRCFGPTAYFVVLNRISESVPVLVSDALFFKYSFGSGGFVNLTSGMRLHINRSMFRDAPGGAETVANYLGERTVYYRIVDKQGNELALKLSGIENSPGLQSKSDQQFQDTRLAQDFRATRALRLFLFTLFVPNRQRRAALLIGAQTPQELTQATAAVSKNPEIPCEQLVSLGVECASLDGTVSMSVDMNVIVNGKVEYFPVGSTVESVLGDIPKTQLAGALKTLRIQRLFRGKYAEMEFNHNSRAPSQITLFTGDQLSWKKLR